MSEFAKIRQLEQKEAQAWEDATEKSWSNQSLYF